MITKFCIVCLCMTASTMIGLLYTKSKKARVDYFHACVKLSDKLIADISFRKDNLFTILQEFAATDKSALKEQIARFSESPYEPLTVNGKLLKENEKQLLSEFFASLGATDAYTQISTLENYRARFDDIYREEYDAFKKSGHIGLKLSVLIGLAIGILIL